MLGHGAKFGQKMEQAIAALLSHRNVEDAARAVGISANTLLRWMKEPEFEAAYREARRTAFSQTIGRLQDFAAAAVTTVVRIMADSNTPPGTRLRAAEIVLEQAAKVAEIDDIDDRVTKLERLVGSAMKSPKSSGDLTRSSAAPLPGPATTRAQIAAPPLDSAETDEDVVE